MAGHLADISIVDRDSGRQLDTYYRHGEYWVAGEPGARYSIRIRNHLGERVLAVTSVDGINVITGENAGWDQSGYVFDGWEDYQIDGWRKSDTQVAAFAFAAAPASYAARTGRPENVGIIGIALFREQPAYAALPPPAPQIAANGVAGAQRFPPAMDRARSGPAAPAAESAAADAKAAELAADAPAGAPLLQAPSLGTAHGEREYSYAAHTHFIRRQWHPDEIIRIRYDRLENLVAMGIVRARPQDLAHPRPFPGTDGQDYVPDPPAIPDAGLLR